MVLYPALKKKSYRIQQVVQTICHYRRRCCRSSSTQTDHTFWSPKCTQTLDCVGVAGKKKGTNLAFILFQTEAWHSFRPRDRVSCLWIIAAFETGRVCECVRCGKHWYRFLCISSYKKKQTKTKQKGGVVKQTIKKPTSRLLLSKCCSVISGRVLFSEHFYWLIIKVKF